MSRCCRVFLKWKPLCHGSFSLHLAQISKPLLKFLSEQTVRQGYDFCWLSTLPERGNKISVTQEATSLSPLRQVISGCFNFIHLATSETPSPVPLYKLNSRPNWDIYLLPPASGPVLTNVATEDNQRSNLAPVTARLVLHGRQECWEVRSNCSGVRGTCDRLLTWSCSSCVTSGKLCYLACWASHSASVKWA